MLILNDTINGNASTINGGGFALTGTGAVNIQNTIVAHNIAGNIAPDVATGPGLQVTDLGGNLIGIRSGSTGFGTTLSDPIAFGVLENNGGFYAGAGASRQVVQTEAIFPGSQGIGQGVVAGAPSTDARGFARPAAGSSTVTVGAWEPQYANGSSGNLIFVENIYEVALNRVGDPGGVAYWTGRLNNGDTRANIIQLIANSNEGQTDTVVNLFGRYLNRGPSNSEITTFDNFLATGGTNEQLSAILTSTSEYYQLHGSTNLGFVYGIFADALNRTPNTAEVGNFLTELSTGMTTLQVGTQIFTSNEYYTAVILSDYATVLGRPADFGGYSFFLGKLQTGTTDQQLLSFLLGSDEGYFGRT